MKAKHGTTRQQYLCISKGLGPPLAIELLFIGPKAGLLVISVQGVRLGPFLGIRAFLPLDAVKLVQGLELGITLPEDPPLDEPRHELGDLVLGKLAGGDGEDIVELLEGALLGLGNKEEDHDQGEDVEACVDAKGAQDARPLEQERESYAQHGGPEQTGCDGKTHANLSVRQGEHLGAVRERDGTFTGGIEHGEEVYEHGDDGSVRGRALGQESSQAGSKQRPGHVGKSEEQQGPASEGVNGPERREGKEPVDQAEAKGCEQCLEVARPIFREDSGGVKCDDVDATQLLGDHDGEGSQSSATHTGNGEQLDEAREVVAAVEELELDLELRVDVEDVSRHLNRMVAEFCHRLPGIPVPILLHVPARRLRAQVDQEEEGDGGDERSA